MVALTSLFCARRKSELRHDGRSGVQLRGEPILSSLKNKIAVGTGGRSGIGLATAQRFVKEGAYVFLAGRPWQTGSRGFVNGGTVRAYARPNTWTQGWASTPGSA